MRNVPWKRRCGVSDSGRGCSKKRWVVNPYRSVATRSSLQRARCGPSRRGGICTELSDTDLAATVDRRLAPRQAGVAVADIDATQSERPFRIRHVPEGRSPVVSQKVEEYTLRLHLDGHRSSVASAVALLIQSA